MTYREHAPPPGLAPWLDCLWTREAPGAEGGSALAEEHHVVPDGCLDILVSVEASTGAAQGLVVGTMTRPLPVRHEGGTDLVAVRFRPGAASAFLPLPAHELTDHAVPLGELWGAAGRTVADRMAEAPRGPERLTVLAETLLARRPSGAGAPDPAVAHALTRLAARRPPSVAEVAAEVGLGRRQLGRRFLEAVGTPPSVTLRVLRFQRALRLLHDRPGIPLTEVAWASGYHDQPHLTREFRALAGEAPGAYRIRRRLTAPRSRPQP